MTYIFNEGIISCKSRALNFRTSKACNKLARAMANAPRDFSGLLHLEYTVGPGGALQRKFPIPAQTVLRGAHMATKIVGLATAESNMRYIRPEVRRAKKWESLRTRGNYLIELLLYDV